jgi:hypothetical protein
LEAEYAVKGIDAYKQIGAPQWLIDWNEGIIDTYYNK